MGILATDTHALDYQPLSSLLVKTIISSLVIISSFCLRDVIVTGVAIFVPADLTKKFVFTTLIALFFLFATVLMAWSFQEKVDES